MMVIIRVRQGLRALRPRVPSGHEADIARILTLEQRAAFLDLPAADRAHLIRVYRQLVTAGVDNPDLLAAALLHDIGKVAADGHVRLVDRVGHVLLGRIAPHLLRRWATLPAPTWRRGLALAAHHAELGAARAASLGCSLRTCWLIAHHDDPTALGDPDLRLLAAADHDAG